MRGGKFVLEMFSNKYFNFEINLEVAHHLPTWPIKLLLKVLFPQQKGSNPLVLDGAFG